MTTPPPAGAQQVARDLLDAWMPTTYGETDIANKDFENLAQRIATALEAHATQRAGEVWLKAAEILHLVAMDEGMDSRGLTGLEVEKRLDGLALDFRRRAALQEPSGEPHATP